jgi:RNA polymerase sigma-70 factor (ECF subfamily)
MYLEDERILDLFFERSEQAIEELSQKYGRIMLKISKNTLGSQRDAEECVNDAYLGVWNAIPPARPKPLLAFVCRIVRNVSINRRVKNEALKRGGNYAACAEELDSVLPSAGGPEEHIDAAALSSSIDGFLAKLPDTDRMLFIRRFFYMDSYEELADASGIREGTIRTRLSRVRNKLKDHLKKEGFAV